MEAPDPKRRPRLSLFSLLLLTALAATSLSTFLLWSEVGPLRRDLRRLRDERGEVSVTDLSRPHAIQVDTGDLHHWKWRVWIPEGRWYDVVCVHNAVPAGGLATPGESVSTLDAGEHVVEYRLEPAAEEGVWIASATTARGVRMRRVGWGDPRWVHLHGVARVTQNSPADDPFVLMRYRVADDADPKNTPGKTDGFMLWLEPR